MGTQATSSRIYNLNINVLAAELRSRRFTDVLRVSLKSENPMPGGCWFRFHHGMTFTSYGERITVTLNAINENTTMVEIHSEAAVPTQLIDFGINNRNISAIFQHLDHNVLFPYMASTGQTIPYQAAPQTAPPQSYQAAPAMICPRCGARIEAHFKFCNCCGAQLR